VVLIVILLQFMEIAVWILGGVDVMKGVMADIIGHVSD
jgi:hypothetical protein